MQADSRPSISDWLAALVSLAGILLTGLACWLDFQSAEMLSLMFGTPVLVASLLLLWNHRAEVRRRPVPLLAGLLASPVLLCTLALPQTMGLAELSAKGLRQGTAVPWLSEVLVYFVLPGIACALTRWCYVGLCRLLATFPPFLGARPA